MRPYNIKHCLMISAYACIFFLMTFNSYGKNSDNTKITALPFLKNKKEFTQHLRNARQNKDNNFFSQYASTSEKIHLYNIDLSNMNFSDFNFSNVAFHLKELPWFIKKKDKIDRLKTSSYALDLSNTTIDNGQLLSIYDPYSLYKARVRLENTSLTQTAFNFPIQGEINNLKLFGPKDKAGIFYLRRSVHFKNNFFKDTHLTIQIRSYYGQLVFFDFVEVINSDIIIDSTYHNNQNPHSNVYQLKFKNFQLKDHSTLILRGNIDFLQNNFINMTLDNTVKIKLDQIAMKAFNNTTNKYIHVTVIDENNKAISIKFADLVQYPQGNPIITAE